MSIRRSRSICRVAAAACAATLLGVCASGMPLRILPLGDSITWGWGGESSYGYRGPLADLMTQNGINFEYVGSIADDITINGTRFIDPAVRQLVGSPLHYGIPGANADTVDGSGNSVSNKDSLLWSIRNDRNGDESFDASFSAAGGLIPTLVSQNKAPDAVLLHVGTNAIGRSNGQLRTVVTPGTGAARYLGTNNNADAQLFRLLDGLGDDLANQGLLTGSADDTRIILSRIIPRPVDSRQTPRGSSGTNGIDFGILQNGIDYNAAIDSVVASLDPLIRNAITLVDMFDIDITDPVFGLTGRRNDGIIDQPFDTLTGSGSAFNEANQKVGGVLVDEANANGPDYADWLLRYDEAGQDFYDAAYNANDLRWNQGLYGIQVNGQFYDAIHPNLTGYELMAHVWYAGLFGGANLLAGDFTGNGAVEQGDLDLVLNNWGLDTTGAVPAGWNNTAGLLGVVDQSELDAVLNNWGSAQSPSFAGVLVPEPVVLGFVSAGAFLLGRRRPLADVYRRTCRVG